MTSEQRYDVFLSHNSKDKSTSVRQLAHALVNRRIKVWMDEWELQPGRRWQPELMKIIQTARSAAVLVGENGLGPWEDVEVEGLLIECVSREMPIIPVLLPGAPENVELPLFLKRFTWVDCRSGLTEEYLSRLIWGINGQKPESIRTPTEPSSSHPVDAVVNDRETEIRSASKGLSLLASLLKSPRVRDKVVSFQTEFETISRQIGLLGDYKALHDCLHVIQFQCQNLLSSVTMKGTTDDNDWSILESAEKTLRDKIAEMQRVVARAVVPAMETAWIDELAAAQQDLRMACDQCDSTPLKKAGRRIGRVMNLRPSDINTRLNATAKTIRLTSLVDAMMLVREQVDIADFAEAQIEQFRDGWDAMDRLHQKLHAQVALHDDWQQVDIELRPVEANLESDLSYLEDSWPSIKRRVESLYGVVTESWVAPLRDAVVRLNSALTGSDHNDSKIRRAFRSVWREAIGKFFLVDEELRDLCDDLREVGTPLATVLKVLE